MLTLILLTLLILIHELGHYLAAKKFGVKVEEFGIGLPPKALTLGKRGETEFTLNWLPIGGFVRLFGEDADPTLWEKLNPFERRKSLEHKPAWQRVIIMAAGVVMNFLVGIILFAVIYTVVGVPVEQGSQVYISQVAKNSPAESVGLKLNEVITQVNGVEVADSAQFIEQVADKKGTQVELIVVDVNSDGTRGRERKVMVTPRINPPEGEGALGVGVYTVPIIEYKKKAWYTAPFYGAVEGFKEAFGWTRVMVSMLMHPAELWKNVSGPIEVVKVGQEQAREGWMAFLRFGGIISFNLAVFNLLPFPALDGGRIVMVGLEKIVGRKRVARVEKYVNTFGMIVLLLFMGVVMVRDFLK